MMAAVIVGFDIAKDLEDCRATQFRMAALIAYSNESIVFRVG